MEWQECCSTSVVGHNFEEYSLKVRKETAHLATLWAAKSNLRRKIMILVMRQSHS